MLLPCIMCKKSLSSSDLNIISADKKILNKKFQQLYSLQIIMLIRCHYETVA